MKKKSLFLIFGLLFTKMFGIVRELALGNLYGPSPIADAYIISSNIPNVIFGFIAAGLVTTFIPIYSKIYNRDGGEKAERFTSNILNVLFVLSLILAVLGFVFAEFIVSVFAGGFEPSTQVLAVSFVRVTIFSVVFLSTKSILEGYLQIKQMFNIIPLNGFILNLVVIGSIVVAYATETPSIMAYGVLISIILQSVVSLYYSRKKKYKHELVLDLKDENMGAMVKMAAPIVLGSSIDQINRIIDTTIASGVMSGGVSTMSYASKISDSISGIFVNAISTVLYPSLADQASKGLMDELKITIKKVMTTINLLIIPASVGLMILAYPVLDLLYGRKFTPAQLDTTTQVLIFYTIGTIAYGLRQILTRTFYALHDSITPVISGVFSVIINIALNLILSHYMGLPGLALATSIAALVSLVFLYVALRRKIGPMYTGLFLGSSLKIIGSSLIMGLVVYAVYQLISGTVGMMVSIVCGIVAYVIAIYVMKIEETEEIFDVIRKKISKKK